MAGRVLRHTALTAPRPRQHLEISAGEKVTPLVGGSTSLSRDVLRHRRYSSGALAPSPLRQYDATTIPWCLASIDTSSHREGGGGSRFSSLRFYPV